MMKKKICVALMLVLVLSTVLFAFAGCGGDKGDGSGTTDGGKKQIPVYQGMTISSAEQKVNAMSEEYLSDGKDGFDYEKDNGKHNGHFKGDHTGKDEDLDEADPYPDNAPDENIEEEIGSTIEIVGTSQEMYCAAPGEDIYINIHISNPDNFEIMSFTLNGKKYSSYMFEEGSDMETLILKYNVGAVSGVVEYTIDAIKYIDGEDIKDVLIDGDTTVKAGVKTEGQVTASISGLTVGTNEIAFSANVTDKDGLIALSGGALKAVLYDGDTIVAEQDIALGDNSVTFGGLKTTTLYQYAIVGFYDDLSGAGFGANVLFKSAVNTDSIVLFDNVTVGEDGIGFDFFKNDNAPDAQITAIKLYHGGELFREFPVGTLSIEGLLSDNEYVLVAEYTVGTAAESISLSFTTASKAAPDFTVTGTAVTKDLIGFSIAVTDPDGVGFVSLVELIYKGEVVTTLANDIAQSATGLFSDNEYTVRVTYSYDLNDGNGVQTLVRELNAKTEAQTAPDFSITGISKTSSSISFGITENDPDGLGSVFQIELLHKNGTVMADSNDVRKFDGLLSNNDYTLKVTYAYDLNDNSGQKLIEKTVEIKTDAKAVPSISFDNVVATFSGISFGINEVDVDNVGKITWIELLQGSDVVRSTVDGSVRSFSNLLSNTEYVIRLTYEYNIGDGSDDVTVIKTVTVKTGDVNVPFILLSGGTQTQTSIGFAVEESDASNVGAITKIELYRGDVFVKSAANTEIREFTGLLSNTEYTVKVTYVYNLGDGKGDKTETREISVKTFAKAKPGVTFEDVDKTKTSVSFDLDIVDVDKVGYIYRIELITGGIVVKTTANPDTRGFDELLSDTTYVIKLIYAYDVNEGSGTEYIEKTAEVKTYAMEQPTFTLHTATSTKTSIGFSASETDPDNVGEITKIELYRGGVLVKSAANTEIREFTGLLSNNSYTVKVTYVYNLNNGTGSQTVIETLSIKTLAKATPSISISTTAREQESLGFSVRVTDPDSVGALTKVEFLHGGVVVKTLENTTAHEIAELLSNNSYVLRVTYTYDLNDGAGERNMTKELSVKTKAKTTPSISISTTAREQESLGFSVSVTDPDSVGAITKVELLHGGEVVKTLENTTAHEIAELLSNNSYTLRVTYTYDLNDGAGKRSMTKELSVKTVAKAAPKFEIQNIKTTSGSIDADHEAQDTDSTLVSYTVAIYNGDALVETNGEQKISFAGLNYGVDYTVCITYTFDLNDGKGEQTESCRAIVRTASSGLAYEVSGDSCTVTGIGECEDTVIVIGEYIDGYRVVGIGANAFEGCTATVIVIPDTVETIGNRAFYNATGITEITVPASVTSIGTQVFFKASNLTTVYYNSVYGSADNPFLNNASISTVIFGGTSIPDRILYGSTNLKNVVITDSVTSIGTYAFCDCTSLTSVTIGNSVTSIGTAAFEGCTSLTGVTIPDSVTSIDTSAFFNCDNLMSVTIGNSVTSIGDQAFYDCTSLTGVTIPDSVTIIGSSAFEGCTSLTSVCITDIAKWCGISFGNEPANPLYQGGNLYLNGEHVTELVIPDSVTSIGSSAFSYCTRLTSVTIGNSVTSIGDYAFRGCTGLTSVTILDRVKSIGTAAFEGCTSLTSVIIGNSVTSISDLAFRGCTGLTSVTIPDRVKSIGTAAFEGCKSLTSVIIGNSVTSIGDLAFYECAGLTSVIIGNSVTSVGDSAFYNCTSLTSVTFGNSVTSIGSYAFSGCTSLTSVDIPDSVKSIGTLAFHNCDSLISVTIGNSVTSIGAQAFYDCTSLTSVTIPDNVTSIGNNTFYNCVGLTSVVIGNSVTSIGYQAFFGCSGLTSVTIGNSVTNIDYSAFYNCYKLAEVINRSTLDISAGSDNYGHIGYYAIEVHTGESKIVNADDYLFITSGGVNYLLSYLGNDTELVLPESYNGENYEINDFAFYGSVDLTSVTIPDSVTGIGYYAFNDCTNLASVTIPDSVTSIGDYAFSNCSSLTIYCEATSTPDGWASYWNASCCPVIWGCTGSHGITDDGFKWASIVEGIAIIGYSGSDTEIIIPEDINGIDVVAIYENAFKGNTTVKKVTIPDSVMGIGNYAFSECTALEEINFNATAMNDLSSSNGAFYNAGIHENGIKVVIGANVTKIPAFLFHSTSGSSNLPNNISSVEFEEDSVCTSIGSAAFVYCISLTSVTIPDSVTSIGDFAFYCCAYLSEVTIGNSVESIGNYAFSVTSLDELSIPDNVKTIGIGAFEGDILLKSVKLGNGVESIGDYAFHNCSDLTSVEIPNSVTSIGDSAFRGCKSLTSVTIPNSVTSIGCDVFYNCTSLESITLPFVGADIDGTDNPYFGYIFGGSNTDGVPSSLKKVVITGGKIYDYAFEGCSGLTSVTVLDGVTSIGYGAFYECTGLESITLPFVGATKGGTSNTLFGYIFGANHYTENANFVPSSLKAVVITGGETIPSYAFYGCSSLTSVTIPDSVKSIGSYAFDSCSGLASVIIPDSVKSIGSYAFQKCTGLTIYCKAASKPSGWKNDWNKAMCPVIWGYTGTHGITNEGLKWASTVGGIDIYGYSGTNTKIVIPEDINGIDVVFISDSAFKGNTIIKSATIPNSVTSIGNNAFYNCTRLTSVTIPDSVTSIGDSTFSGCTSLTSVELPNSVTSIGSSAFSGCTGLASVTIPDSVTSIGNYAFSGCTSLASVTIPNSVTSIGNSTFSGCTSLTSVTIPNSVTSIGSSAFAGCTSLESITLPFVGATKDGTSNTHFGYIFGASRLESNIDYVPSSLREVVIAGGEIANNAFNGCPGITSITVLDGVTSIAQYAFSGCSNIESITLPFVGATKDGTSSTHFGYIFGASQFSEHPSYVPSSLKTVVITGGESISSFAFYICDNLTSVTIPDTVTSIGDYAFQACHNLTSVNIPGGVTSISYGTFSGCTSLTSVEIPNSVTSIGDYAFSGCTSLASVTIPNSVTSIGNSTFSGCTSLTSVTIPDSVTSIGDYAFLECTSLKSVTVGKGVTSIGFAAFSAMPSSLESITLPFVGATKDGTINTHFGYIFGAESYAANGTSVPSSLKNVVITGGYGIGSYAFNECGSLTSISLPSTVTSIGNHAFYNCIGLTSVNVPDSVTSIGSSAFSGCESLTSVNIPNGIESIGDYTFKNCAALASVIIPDSVTSIGNYAFEGCTSLKSATFGKGLLTVGNGAFSYCNGLTSVIIPENVTSIGQFAFADCTALASVNIGKSVKSIGDGAFSGCRGVASITFEGTVSQWNAVSKGEAWNYRIGASEVVCSDGTVTL